MTPSQTVPSVPHLGWTWRLACQVVPASLALGALVVSPSSARAQSSARIPESPTAVSRSAVGCQVITADQMGKYSSVTRALQRRVTGLKLSATSGQAGAGSSVHLRGFGSVRSSAPMIFVDGLRMTGSRTGGGQGISVLDLLNPDDVQLIEVFRGAAATTLYGTDAAGGVIRIFSKQGFSGGARPVDVRAECIP